MQYMPIRPHFAACDGELAAWTQEREELTALLASAAANGRTQYAPAMNARARLAELTRLIALAEQARRGGVTVAPRTTPSTNARAGGLSTNHYAPTVPYWLKRSRNTDEAQAQPSTTKLDAKEFMLPARPYYERPAKVERPATPSKPANPASQTTVEMKQRGDVANHLHWGTFSDPREMALQKMVRARPELLKQ